METSDLVRQPLALTLFCFLVLYLSGQSLLLYFNFQRQTCSADILSIIRDFSCLKIQVISRCIDAGYTVIRAQAAFKTPFICIPADRLFEKNTAVTCKNTAVSDRRNACFDTRIGKIECLRREMRPYKKIRRSLTAATFASILGGGKLKA